MPTSEIPQVSILINRRFYEAIDLLKGQRRIRGLGTLAKQWDVSRFALSWSLNHPGEKRIKIEFLYYISRDYNVSLDWLFFGKGEIFK